MFHNLFQQFYCAFQLIYQSKTNFTDHLFVSFGSLNWTFGFQHNISKVVVHPSNSADTDGDNYGDIALLRLSRPIRMVKVFGYYLVNSICLPEKKRDYMGFATMAGWGQTRKLHPKTKMWIYLQTVFIKLG